MSQDTTIPIGLQGLLTELDFIGQISRGQKPMMSEMVLVENTEYWKRVTKWWSGETKDTIMTKIENIVNRTVDAIIDHKETAYIGLLVNKFSQARAGIESLKITYEHYPKTISKINTQLDNIDLQLKNYRHLIKGYKNVDNNYSNNEDEKSENKISDTEVDINTDVEYFNLNSSEKKKSRRQRIKQNLDKLS